MCICCSGGCSCSCVRTDEDREGGDSSRLYRHFLPSVPPHSTLTSHSQARQNPTYRKDGRSSFASCFCPRLREKERVSCVRAVTNWWVVVDVKGGVTSLGDEGGNFWGGSPRKTRRQATESWNVGAGERGIIGMRGHCCNVGGALVLRVLKGTVGKEVYC